MAIAQMVKFVMGEDALSVLITQIVIHTQLNQSAGMGIARDVPIIMNVHLENHV